MIIVSRNASLAILGGVLVMPVAAFCWNKTLFFRITSLASSKYRPSYEEKLLRYFSQSKKLLPEAWGSLSKLQGAVEVDAARVVTATLFPPVIDLNGSGREECCSSAESTQPHYPSSYRASHTVDPRLLSNRFTNAWESSKKYGFSEVGIDSLARSIANAWTMSVEAWNSVCVSFAASNECNINRLPSDMAVLFLVLHGSTRHQMGSGDVLHQIGQTVQRMIHSPVNAQLFSSVLRVIIISVGNQSGLTERDMMSFPHAGMYTLRAIFSLLASLPVCQQSIGLKRDRKPKYRSEMTASRINNSDSALSVRLAPSVYVVSDGFLHPRSCAEASRSSTCPIEVFPSVVSNSLTKEEVKAFACYIAMQFASRSVSKKVV